MSDHGGDDAAGLPLRASASVLAVPIFRAVYLASVVSNVGTFMQDVGEAWLMVALGGSPLQIALVSATTWAPAVVLALPSGALADQLDRRVILCVAQAWMALSALALAVAAHAGVVTPLWLLVATTSLGIGNAVTGPSWSTLVPELVPRSRLPEAVALQSTSWNIARAVGPALGGLVVARLGPAAAFALNAVSFALLIAVVARTPDLPREVVRTPMTRAIREGLAYFARTRELVALSVCTAAFGLFAAPVLALLPAYVARVLAGDSRLFGLCLGAFGAGALGGALVMRRLRVSVRASVLMPLGMAVHGLAALGLARATSWGWAALALVPAGATWLGVLSTQNALVQLVAEGPLRGRVKSIDALLFLGTYAAGGATAGWAANRLGVSRVVGAGGALVLVAAIVAWAVRLPDLAGRDA